MFRHGKSTNNNKGFMFNNVGVLIQWTLEIVDLDIVDSLVLVDKIVLTIYDFMK